MLSGLVVITIEGEYGYQAIIARTVITLYAITIHTLAIVIPILDKQVRTTIATTVQVHTTDVVVGIHYLHYSIDSSLARIREVR